jgi:hypothetical protein
LSSTNPDVEINYIEHPPDGGALRSMGVDTGSFIAAGTSTGTWGELQRDVCPWDDPSGEVEGDDNPARSGSSAWRFARRVLIVVVAHLLAAAAGLNILEELFVYAALVGIGVLPSRRPPALLSSATRNRYGAA